MVTLNDWPWTCPTYQFPVSIEDSRIKSITIDPLGRLADVDQTDNEWPKNLNVNL